MLLCSRMQIKNTIFEVLESFCDMFKWKHLNDFLSSPSSLSLSLSLIYPLFLYQGVLGKCQAPVLLKEGITFHFLKCHPVSQVLVTMGTRSDGQSSKVESWFTRAVKQVKSLQSCSQGDINAKKSYFDFLNVMIFKEVSGQWCLMLIIYIFFFK